jgi:hypothetical protein
MLRYLRIVVSALSLMACVLLVAFWVRSYRSTETAAGRLIAPYGFGVNSQCGRLNFMVFEDGKLGIKRRWGLSCEPVGDECVRFGPTWFFGPLVAGTWLVVIPHWFLALVAAALAGLPWLKWRFSLRTLLIAMTIVAVILGIVAAFN